MLKTICHFCRATHGATAIEYGMIACLIVVAITASIQALGASVSSMLYSKLVAAFG
jgi:Flp pilus assembly pilin Flp